MAEGEKLQADPEPRTLTTFGVTIGKEVCEAIDEHVRLTSEQWRSSFEYAASVRLQNVRRKTPNEADVPTKEETAEAINAVRWKYQQFLPHRERNLRI